MRLQTAFTALASLTKQTQNVKDPTLRKRNAVRTGVEQTKQQRKQVSSKSAAGLELMLQKEQIAELRRESWKGKGTATILCATPSGSCYFSLS